MLSNCPCHCLSRSTRHFLNQLQTVGENHNFFNPGFTPDEMDQLPGLYHDVINDPLFLHDAFNIAHGKYSHNYVAERVVRIVLLFFGVWEFEIELQDVVLLPSRVCIFSPHFLIFVVEVKASHYATCLDTCGCGYMWACLLQRSGFDNKPFLMALTFHRVDMIAIKLTAPPLCKVFLDLAHYILYLVRLR